MENYEIEIVGTMPEFNKHFHQLADKMLSQKQVSNTLNEIHIILFIFFSNFYSLLYLSSIFINHQEHCSSEINP